MTTETPELSVGTVLVERYGFAGMALTEVVRLTAKQAITRNGTRYRLEDGGLVGSVLSAAGGWKSGPSQAESHAVSRPLKRVTILLLTFVIACRIHSSV